jgi:hypothetical protein
MTKLFPKLCKFALVALLAAVLPLSSLEAKNPRGAAGVVAQGYTGQISISGNTFVNGANGSGSTLLLKGVNNSGMEIYGVHQAGVAWDGNPPDWTTLGTWASNMSGSSACITRIPLSSQSFLGLTTYAPTNSTTWGAQNNLGVGNGTADPLANYKSTLVTAIQAARAAKCYIDLDLHWVSTQLTLGGTTHYATYIGQNGFMDQSNGLTFWTDSTVSLPVWLANTFGSAAFNTAHGYNGGAAGADYNSSYGGASGFGDIVFELFNEPFLGTGTYSAGSADLALLNGGTGNTYITNGGGNISTTVTYTGYQAVVTGIRALGINNPIIFNGNGYTSQLENYLNWKPTDSVNQIAAGWHPYSQAAYPYTSSPFQYPGIGSDSGAGTTSAVQWAQAVLTAGIPVIITEDGNDVSSNGGTNATSGEPHMTYMINWASARNVGYIPWTFGDGDYWASHNAANTQNQILQQNSGSTARIPVEGEGWVTYEYISGNSAPTFTNSTTLPSGTVSTSYSVTFVGTGGAGSPYTFAWVSDNGSGCTSGSLNTSTGVYACTLTSTPGTYSIVITVLDQYQIATSTTFSLTVNSVSSDFFVYNGNGTNPPGTSGALKSTWSQDLSFGTFTVKYNDTTHVQSGQTYDMLFTANGSAGGWQPASNTHALDIHTYTWMTWDYYTAVSDSNPFMQWHYSQGSNDVYTNAAVSGWPAWVAWGNTGLTTNAWNPHIKVPMAAFGMMGQYAGYKFLLEDQASDSTYFATDEVGFVPGGYVWLYDGGMYNGSGNDASTPLQGFSDASINATSTYSNLPTVANASFSAALNGMVTPSSGTSASTNIIKVVTTALHGGWKITNSSGLALGSYTYFTFGAYPTLSGTSQTYNVQLYNTSGTAIGNQVLATSYTGNNFGTNTAASGTPVFTVFAIPLSAFGSLGTTTIGGVAITDATSNTSATYYLSAIGWFY